MVYTSSFSKEMPLKFMLKRQGCVYENGKPLFMGSITIMRKKNALQAIYAQSRV